MAWHNIQDDVFRLLRQLLEQKVERGNIKLRVERGHVDPFDSGPNEPELVDPFDSDFNDHNHYDTNEPEFCASTGLLSYGTVDPLFHGQRLPRVLIAHLPLDDERSYFEIEIVSAGEKCAITVGLVPADYPRDSQPGWNRGSIGYHADDGGIFIERGMPVKLKQPCYAGDRMGCGIEHVRGRQFVYFTKNGQTVAEQPFRFTTLYPAVGLQSPGEKVKLLDAAELWGTETEPQQPANDERQPVPHDRPDVDISPTGHITFKSNEEGCRDAVVIGKVPVSESQSYFEIEIFAMHNGSDVLIAFVPPHFQYNPRHCTAPVYYSAAQGLFCCGEDIARMPDQRSTLSDKIGCGVEFGGNSSFNIYFTRNSETVHEYEFQGVVQGELYPAVILRSSARNTVCVCVQDADGWQFTPNDRREPQSCPSTAPCIQGPRTCSDVVINADCCMASLKPSTDGVLRNATMVSNVPFSTDVSYFEVEFFSGDAVAIGAVASNFPHQKLPGCVAESIGYHSDTGGLFIEDDSAKMFVQRLEVGDSIGCGVNTDDGSRKVFFTRNGSTVTEICFGDDIKALYPAVGLQSVNEETMVYIADLSTSNLWLNQARKTSDQTVPVPAQSPADRLPSDNEPITATSDMMEKINKELECPICWGRLSQPKLLPCCQHTFCLDCISSHVKGSAGGLASCPVCRKSFRLPHRGVAALENNSIANRLLEITKNC